MKAISGNRHPDEMTRKAAWDEMANLRLRGDTWRHIAQLLGFHENTIKKWAKHPEFQILLMRKKTLVFEKSEDAADAAAKQVFDNVRDKIDHYASEAIDHIHHLMTKAENEAVQFRAAQDMADRSPETSRTTKVQTTANVMLFTPEALALAATTARELRNITPAKLLPRPVELETDLLDDPVD